MASGDRPCWDSCVMERQMDESRASLRRENRLAVSLQMEGQTMTGNAMIFEPTAATRNTPQPLRRVLDGLEGKVVGFIDNVKPNFHFLVDDLAELLIGKYGVFSVIKRRKRTASVPAPEDIIADVTRQCDLVITGSGD